MKKLLQLSLLLLTAAFARADLVIEQQIDSAALKGNMTMKIKGDKARMDIPNPLGGAPMTVLMDLKAGDLTTLVNMNDQKIAMKTSFAEAKKAAEAQNVDLSKIEKPKATGKTEKVGDWNCEIYEVNVNGGVGKMWVAKDFPNGKAIMDQMNKIQAAASNGLGFDPSKFALDGMTVKTEMDVPLAGKMTTTLVKAKEEAVADSEFEVPPGYNVMTMPGAK